MKGRAPYTVFILGLLGAAAVTVNATTLSVVGPDGISSSFSASVGDTIQVGVDVGSYADLYAWQFDLSWNPVLLSLESITEGEALSNAGTTFFVPGVIDNSAGTVTDNADTLVGPILGAAGTSGPLAYFDFTATGAGSTVISVANVILLDSNLNNISANTVPENVTIDGASPLPTPEPASSMLVLLGGIATLATFAFRPKSLKYLAIATARPWMLIALILSAVGASKGQSPCNSITYDNIYGQTGNFYFFIEQGSTTLFGTSYYTSPSGSFIIDTSHLGITQGTSYTLMVVAYGDTGIGVGFSFSNYKITLSPDLQFTDGTQSKSGFFMAPNSLKLTFTRVANATCGPVLLDPVPDLLTSSGAISTDPSVLGSKGRVITGVAADGVTRAVLRIPALTITDGFSVQLLDANGNPSLDASRDGYLEVAGNSVGASALVYAQGTGNGSPPMAFVTYRAPDDFITADSPASDQNQRTRTVTLSVTSLYNTSTSSSGTTNVPVAIYRPPIALVHGVWSSAAAWDDFTPVTQNPAFSTLDGPLYRVDYSRTAGASFDTNWPIVRQQMLAFLQDYRTVNDVAAIQVDVVAHSMGGLLVRDLASQPDYTSKTNFESGMVHKLITIDTPHEGSDFARNLATSTGTPCGTALGLGLALTNRVDAVLLLSTGSDAIDKLNNVTASAQLLRAHTVVAIASAGQEQASEASPAFTILAEGCPSVIKPFEQVFRGASDLLVSESSQAGLSAFSTPPVASPPYPGFVHAVVNFFGLGPFPFGPDVLGSPGLPVSDSAPDRLAVANEVVLLLNTSSTDSTAFGDMKP